MLQLARLGSDTRESCCCAVARPSNDMCVSKASLASSSFERLQVRRRRRKLNIYGVAACEIDGTFALPEALKHRTDPSVGRSRVRECGTSGHAAAHGGQRGLLTQPACQPVSARKRARAMPYSRLACDVNGGAGGGTGRSSSDWNMGTTPIDGQCTWLAAMCAPPLPPQEP